MDQKKKICQSCYWSRSTVSPDWNARVVNRSSRQVSWRLCLNVWPRERRPMPCRGLTAARRVWSVAVEPSAALAVSSPWRRTSGYHSYLAPELLEIVPPSVHYFFFRCSSLIFCSGCSLLLFCSGCWLPAVVTVIWRSALVRSCGHSASSCSLMPLWLPPWRSCSQCKHRRWVRVTASLKWLALLFVWKVRHPVVEPETCAEVNLVYMLLKCV